MVFWGLKHTILVNILLINHMVCRYNKLCPCVRNTRDMVLIVHDDLFRPETRENPGGGGGVYLIGACTSSA